MRNVWASFVVVTTCCCNTAKSSCSAKHSQSEDLRTFKSSLKRQQLFGIFYTRTLSDLKLEFPRFIQKTHHPQIKWNKLIIFVEALILYGWMWNKCAVTQPLMSPYVLVQGKSHRLGDNYDDFRRRLFSSGHVGQHTWCIHGMVL